MTIEFEHKPSSPGLDELNSERLELKAPLIYRIIYLVVLPCVLIILPFLFNFYAFTVGAFIVLFITWVIGIIRLLIIYQRYFKTKRLSRAYKHALTRITTTGKIEIKAEEFIISIDEKTEHVPVSTIKLLHADSRYITFSYTGHFIYLTKQSVPENTYEELLNYMQKQFTIESLK